MKRNNMVTGALVLSASAIFVRMIGFFFRIYLSNTMGAEGMGVYMLIISMYGLCVTLSTSGISVAVSTLVAEQFSLGKPANAKRVLRRASGLSLLLSCTVMIVVLLFAQPIGVHILKDERTVLSLRFLALGLPFLSVSSCLRGYFIACRRVGNPAVGQVLEQLFKMAFIMALIGRFLPMGISVTCGVVVLGISLGEVVCFLYSWWGYIKAKKRTKSVEKATITGVNAKILKIIVPISVSAYVRSALRLVEDVMILSGLKTFSGQDDVATGMYGMLKGMVMPLLVFPLSLLSSFVITLTPEISRINARNNPQQLERAISKILGYTFLSGIMIVAVFMTFSYELGAVIYKDAEVGEMLRQLSFLCPFMCVEMVVVGILQGMGEQVSSMRYSLGDSFLRIALIYLLIPASGVKGFMAMVIASNLFTSVLNLYRLLKVTHMRFRFNAWVLKPCLAAAASSQAVLALYNYCPMNGLPDWLYLALGLGVLVAAYVLLLFSIGCIRLEDFAFIWNKLKFPSKPPKTAPETPV